MTSVVDKPDFPTWATSVEADFTENTWLFRMCNDHYEVSAGTYALIHNDDYDAMMHEISAARERIDHAKRLLNHLREQVPPHEQEKIDSFFDPEPLG
jgi:hypothetical protein